LTRTSSTIPLVLETDVAGIDAVFVERVRAVRIPREQRVTVVVEVPDDRHAYAHARQPLADRRHRFRGFLAIDGDADYLGTRPRQGRNLPRRAVGIGGVGIGHRLHYDRAPAAYHHAPDVDGVSLVAFGRAGQHVRTCSQLGWHCLPHLCVAANWGQ
jgi:hypothetical protein